MPRLCLANLILFAAIGCGGNDARMEQLSKDFESTGRSPTDNELKEIIKETEKEHGKATHDNHGYPLYELRPWEKPKQPWSWNQTTKPFTVRPARNQESHIKTAPLVEHRYIEIHYPNTSEAAIVEAAAAEVWHHFAKEVDDRHPQADFKMVIVYIYVDNQEYQTPVGRIANAASRKLPDHPQIEWNKWNKSRLVFGPAR